MTSLPTAPLVSVDAIREAHAAVAPFVLRTPTMLAMRTGALRHAGADNSVCPGQPAARALHGRVYKPGTFQIMCTHEMIHILD